MNENYKLKHIVLHHGSENRVRLNNIARTRKRERERVLGTVVESIVVKWRSTVPILGHVSCEELTNESENEANDWNDGCTSLVMT